MKYKVPKTGYLYIIKRNTRAFEGSKYEVIVNNSKYDVVPSIKQYALDQVSDVVYNIDTQTLDKVHPGQYEMWAEILTDQLGVQVNELLLG
jgi:hypothetical protein